jgi:predicted oxidoreductase
MASLKTGASRILMNTIKLGKSDLQVPVIGLGCVRLAELSIQETVNLIQSSLELGINFFDHADIYTRGESEIRFGEAMKSGFINRENMIIQSKTGNRRGWYDFSKNYLLNQVENSLKSLATDYLDILLLHRPDTLMEPDEVAEAFVQLHREGKVRQFGVSNFNPGQIELLQQTVPFPLQVNQVQFSLVHCGMIDADLNVNMQNELGCDRDGGLLAYSRLNHITLQAWSPFRHGFLGEVFIDNDKFPELNQTMAELGDQYGVSKNAIATAWLLRHPAKMQVMVGTLNSNRLQKISRATTVNLTREEWYRLYKSAGKRVL